MENIPESPESKKLFEDTFNLKIQDRLEAKVEADPIKPDPVPPPPEKQVEPTPMVRGHIEAIALEQPPKGDKTTSGLEDGAVEVATIAVTEEINPVIRTSSVRDDSLPEYLIRPSSLTDFKVRNICESQLSTHDKCCSTLISPLTDAQP